MASTILVADDDRAIRMVLNQALIRLGHDVRMTGNAATLWRWVADGEGDLVITDVIMPDENGLDLIPRIKKIRPELRIIVMSAQNTLLTAVKATERGAFEYLPKPFDLRELVSVVERALTAPPDLPPSEDDLEEQLPLIGRSPAMQEIYRPLAAQFRQTPKRSVRRDQHGRDPPRADRERTLRPREGGLHRGHRTEHGALRTGARRHLVSRRDRRHADRRANPVVARASGGRVHGRRRPCADPRRCANRRRHSQRLAAADPARAISRGSFLPPECRAGTPAAIA